MNEMRKITASIPVSVLCMDKALGGSRARFFSILMRYPSFFDHSLQQEIHSSRLVDIGMKAFEAEVQGT